jgi:hypothetical protein
MKVFAAALAVSLAGVSIVGHAQDPTPVKGILATVHFQLAEPYTDTRSADNSRVSAGALVVLDVDPALVTPRESVAPVLYVGGRPVQRLNHGDKSGHLLVLVPAGTDPAVAPMWFGSADVPEAVTPDKIRNEQARAKLARIGASRKATLARVDRPVVQAKDLAALLRDVAAPLIDEFSPQDRAVAAMWRLPESN